MQSLQLGFCLQKDLEYFVCFFLDEKLHMYFGREIFGLYQFRDILMQVSICWSIYELTYAPLDMLFTFDWADVHQMHNLQQQGKEKGAGKAFLVSHQY